jgi:hypothetical protein
VQIETYHMIASCDSEIAGWDEDGLTFTVKDPVRFETEIIPQFFKHSKFTSFVRVSNNMICLALFHALRWPGVVGSLVWS